MPKQEQTTNKVSPPAAASISDPFAELARPTAKEILLNSSRERKTIDIDFPPSKNSGYMADSDFVQLLRDNGLLSEQWGYSAFNPKLIDKVFETGSYRLDKVTGEPETFVFCARLKQDQSKDMKISDHNDGSVLDYSFSEKWRKYNCAAIAIYDLEKIKAFDSPDQFYFSKEAFLGIIKLTNFYKEPTSLS